MHQWHTYSIFYYAQTLPKIEFLADAACIHLHPSLLQLSVQDADEEAAELDYYVTAGNDHTAFLVHASGQVMQHTVYRQPRAR